MPNSWKCPVCGAPTLIVGVNPVWAVVYRCEICRSDLIYDSQQNKLVVAPRAESA